MRARSSRLASALVAASVTLVRGTHAHAQLFDPSGVRALGEREFGPPEGGGPPPSVTRCSAGEVTGDARLDALIVAGNTVRLAWAPGRYSALPRISDTAVDAAILPAATGVRADLPLTLDAVNGLVAHLHDATTESFTPYPLGGAAWHGASALGVAALDTYGWSDVYALGAGGLSVLTLFALETGTPLEFSFALTQPATGIVALDWSGTANREFAIANADRIELRRYSGVGAFPLPIAGAGARLAVLARPSSGGFERLAAVTRSGAVDTLHIAGFGRATFTLALGDEQISAIAAADLDLDGATDLVLTRATSGNPLYLLQHADGTFALDAGSGVIDVGVPAAGAGPAPLALGDFDSDGDVDVLTFAPAAHGFRLASNLTRSARQATPDAQAEELVETITQMGSPATFHLSISIAAPVVPLAGATHYELTIWRQRDPDSGPELDAVGRVLVPLAVAPGGALPIEPLPVGGPPAGPTPIGAVPVGNLWHAQFPFDDAEQAALLHEIEVREVTLGAQGELVAGGPSGVACYSADLARLAEFSDVQAIDYASALAIVPWHVIFPPGVFGDTSRLNTGIVPMGDVPKFDDDEATDTQLPNPKGGGG